MEKIWNGILRGNNLRVVLRTGYERRLTPPKGAGIVISQNGVKTTGIIIDAEIHDDDDVLDLTVISYRMGGHKVNDGHVVFYISTTNFKKAQRLEAI